MYKEIINTAQQYITERISDVKKLEGGSNNVFKLSAGQNSYIFKEYLNKGSHSDSEPLLYKLLKNPTFLRKPLSWDFSKTHYPKKFAIYNYIEGSRLLDLIQDNKLDSKQINNVIDQILLLIDQFTKIKPIGFGKIDLSSTNHMLIDDWQNFLINYHHQTSLKIKLLNQDLYNLAELTASFIPKILKEEKYQPVLIPCDLNTKNILIDKNNELFLLSGTIMSADADYAIAEFLSHTYNTQLGDAIIAKLSPNRQKLLKLHLYCMISNINVLSFIYEHTSIKGLESYPWGNRNTFYDLLSKHQKQIIKAIYNEKLN